MGHSLPTHGLVVGYQLDVFKIQSVAALLSMETRRIIPLHLHRVPSAKLCSISSAARGAPPLAWMASRTRSAAAR